MEYLYDNIAEVPNLDGIHQGVSASDMSDKSLEWCRWDEMTKKLKVVFTNSLSSEDKLKLDSIVSNNS